MSKNKSVTLQLGAINLAESFYEKAVEQYGDNVLSRLSANAAYLLSAYLAGGMMLKDINLRDIKAAIGKDVMTPEEVVNLVRAGVGMEDGQYTVKAQVDPSYWPNLEQIAEWRGCTPQDLAQSMFNEALGNGWLQQWESDGGSVVLNKDQRLRLKALVGKDYITGEDLLGLVDRLAAQEV